MTGDWTFFSNYGHVLVCLARNRDARLRDVAEEVGLTERAVQKIVRDLQVAGYVEVSKQGRCNRYRINRRKALRHALESHCTVGKLLALVARPGRHDQAAESEQPEAAAGSAEPDRPRPAGREAARAEPAVPEAPGSGQSAPAKEEVKTTDRKAKPPPDTRQQGSLF